MTSTRSEEALVTSARRQTIALAPASPAGACGVAYLVIALVV